MAPWVVDALMFPDETAAELAVAIPQGLLVEALAELTPSHGHVRHASTTRYRPTAATTATVLARDQHCTFPCCHRASRHNDLDHITP